MSGGEFARETGLSSVGTGVRFEIELAVLDVEAQGCVGIDGVSVFAGEGFKLGDWASAGCALRRRVKRARE